MFVRASNSGPGGGGGGGGDVGAAGAGADTGGAGGGVGALALMSFRVGLFRFDHGPAAFSRQFFFELQEPLDQRFGAWRKTWDKDIDRE